MIDINNIIVGNKFLRIDRAYYTNDKRISDEDREVIVTSVSKYHCDINLEFSHTKSLSISCLEFCTGANLNIAKYLQEIKSIAVEPKPRLSFCE